MDPIERVHDLMCQMPATDDPELAATIQRYFALREQAEALEAARRSHSEALIPLLEAYLDLTGGRSF